MLDVNESSKKMIIFTAPSGAGKTTLVRHLLEVFDFLDFSVSVTTRQQRDYEVEAKDYYFVSPEAFKKRIEANDFAEYEEVYENQFYGTLKSEINRIWKLGKHVVFDIDVKGAETLKKLYGDQCHAIFIAPPSLEILVNRLVKRNTESPASLQKRIARVKREMTYEDNFDTVLVNDDLDLALSEAELETLQFIFPKAKLFTHGA